MDQRNRFKNKKSDLELTTEDKIRRTKRVYANSPTFDTTFLDSVEEWISNKGEATSNQSTAVDKIYNRWNVGQQWVQGNYED